MPARRQPFTPVCALPFTHRLCHTLAVAGTGSELSSEKKNFLETKFGKIPTRAESVLRGGGTRAEEGNELGEFFSHR